MIDQTDWFDQIVSFDQTVSFNLTVSFDQTVWLEKLIDLIKLIDLKYDKPQKFVVSICFCQLLLYDFLLSCSIYILQVSSL